MVSFWHSRLNGVEEADELLVPVALHIAVDDGAVEDVESREQCCRAMTLVVVWSSSQLGPSSSADRAGCGQPNMQSMISLAWLRNGVAVPGTELTVKWCGFSKDGHPQRSCC